MAGPALAKVSFLPGMFPFIAPAVAKPVYITRATSTADLTTYTFNDVSLGTAASKRLIVVVAYSSGGGAQTITGVTIAGTAGTSVRNAQAVTGGVAAINVAMFQRLVPAGETGTIVVTHSGPGAERCLIDVYAIYGLASITPFATNSATGTASTTSIATTVDVPEAGVTIAAAQFFTAGTGFTWSGLTEDVDASFDSAVRCTTASDSKMSAEMARAISATLNTSNDRRAIVAASWV